MIYLHDGSRPYCILCDERFLPTFLLSSLFSVEHLPLLLLSSTLPHTTPFLISNDKCHSFSSFLASADGSVVFFLKRPPSNRDGPRPRTLSDIVGAWLVLTVMMRLFHLVNWLCACSQPLIVFLHPYPSFLHIMPHTRPLHPNPLPSPFHTIEFHPQGFVREGPMERERTKWDIPRTDTWSSWTL